MGLLGKCTSSSFGHHPDLHGSANYSSDCEQKGTQAEGLFFLLVHYYCELVHKERWDAVQPHFYHVGQGFRPETMELARCIKPSLIGLILTLVSFLWHVVLFGYNSLPTYCFNVLILYVLICLSS